MNDTSKMKRFISDFRKSAKTQDDKQLANAISDLLVEYEKIERSERIKSGIALKKAQNSLNQARK